MESPPVRASVGCKLFSEPTNTIGRELPRRNIVEGFLPIAAVVIILAIAIRLAAGMFDRSRHRGLYPVPRRKAGRLPLVAVRPRLVRRKARSHLRGDLPRLRWNATPGCLQDQPDVRSLFHPRRGKWAIRAADRSASGRSDHHGPGGRKPPVAGGTGAAQAAALIATVSSETQLARMDSR